MGFVSNSSSSSFTIINKSKNDKSLEDFVMENSHLIDKFNNYYDEDESFEEAIESARNDYEKYTLLKACHSYDVTFGDDEDTILGRIFDYILREGGESENFKWFQISSNR